MGQQVKPQHNTPHLDPPSLLLHTKTDLGQPHRPPPRPLAPGQGASTDPTLPGEGGEPGPPTEGHKSRGGGPCHPPCHRAHQGRKIVFLKPSYSCPLVLMHTHSSHSSRGFSVPLPAPLQLWPPAAMVGAILCLKDQKSSRSTLAAAQHIFLPTQDSAAQASSGHCMGPSTWLLLQCQLKALLIAGATTVLHLPVWMLVPGGHMWRTPAPHGLSEMLYTYQHSLSHCGTGGGEAKL